MKGDIWNTLRIIAGFALVPVAAALVAGALLSGTKGAFIYGFLGAIIIGVPITVLAVPSFFVCRRFGATGPLACMLSGGFMPVLALSMWLFILKDDLAVASGLALLIFIFGAASGWLFWVVAVWRNPLAKRKMARMEAS